MKLLRPLLPVLLLGILLACPVRTTGDQGFPRRPNILFAIADDWSNGHASFFGVQWVRTPNFDRVAREGVLFRNCFTNNPKCSPCRASILTGRNTWQLEEAMNHFGLFSARYAVYPDLLEAAGYHVGFTGKGWGPGDFQGGGFRRNPAGTAYQAARLSPPRAGVGGIDYAANFAAFLEKRRAEQPFCFWYGASEPHREYEPGAGRRAGKNVRDVTLPAYYPDSDLIRSDFLDYALEVEWFDSHLGRMLKLLEDRGELDNTVVVVTSDHGCPFPRVKGQIYEHGFHLPLAVRWGHGIAPGRQVDDFINVRDFAPTFLDLAGLPAHAGMTGRSFAAQLRSRASGWIDRSRNRAAIGKERHDIGRPNDWGYPVRALRTSEYLYVRNYHPERWPAGNPETGYRNVDDSPTKTFLISRFDRFYRLSFGFRPREELYRVAEDPDCVKNLAVEPAHAATLRSLGRELDEMLKADADPRALGRGEIFDTYRYLGNRAHAYDTWLANR